MSGFGKGEKKDENCNYDQDDANCAIVFADIPVCLAAGGLHRLISLRRVRRSDEKSS